jgi:hypothetical protein
MAFVRTVLIITALVVCWIALRSEGAAQATPQATAQTPAVQAAP